MRNNLTGRLQMACKTKKAAPKAKPKKKGGKKK